LIMVGNPPATRGLDQPQFSARFGETLRSQEGALGGGLLIFADRFSAQQVSLFRTVQRLAGLIVAVTSPAVCSAMKTWDARRWAVKGLESARPNFRGSDFIPDTANRSGVG